MVKTLLDNTEADIQSVKKAQELQDNDFVTFQKEASLQTTAGMPLTGGTDGEGRTGANYQKFLEKIEKGEIENGTKIEIKGRFSGDLLGSYFIYNEGSFSFPIYRPDGTEYYGKVELYDLINFSFEVIEESKKILQLRNPDKWKANDKDIVNIVKTINELVREVNKLRKEREEK